MAAVVMTVAAAASIFSAEARAAANGRAPDAARVCTGATFGLWSIGPSLAQGRSWPTATTISDGGVVVVAGSGDDRTVGPDVGPLRSAEIWDPATGNVRRLPPLSVPRVEHSATLLRDGRLAIVGGGRDARRAACAERIELLVSGPGGWTWKEGPALRTPRYAHAAVLLSDGRLMVVGGASCGSAAALLASSEIWDGRSGGFEVGPALERPIGGDRAATAYLLRDGRVLLVGGGTGAAAAVWTPGARRWSSAVIGGEGVDARGFPARIVASAQLRDGTVVAFVARGAEPLAIFTFGAGAGWRRRGSLQLELYAAHATALSSGDLLLMETGRGETFSLAPARWTCARAGQPFEEHDVTAGRLLALRDGRAALLGGRRGTMQSWDPRAAVEGAWSARSPSGISAEQWRSFMAYRTEGLVLSDGRVLEMADKQSRVWDPRTDTVEPLLDMHVKRRQGIAVALRDGFALVGAGLDRDVREPPSGARVVPEGATTGDVVSPNLTKAAESFSPGAGAWSSVPPLRENRLDAAAVLLPDGRVLVAGGGHTLYGPAFRETTAVVYNTKGPFAVSSTEVWRPGDPNWRAGPALRTARQKLGLAVLSDGRVFAACGDPAVREAEVADAALQRWMSTAPMPFTIAQCDVVGLPRDRVLVLGGPEPVLWDAADGAWRKVAAPRFAGWGAVALPDGRVFRGGDQPEIWDPATDRWTPTAVPLVRADTRSFTPLALPDGRVVVGNEVWTPARGRHADGDDDNLSDYIEIVGTAPQLMMLPSVGKLLISDHGQTPLAHGRWRVSGYAAVKDTPDVLARIRALGMKATVPMSVAERKRRMQPAPRSSIEKWNVDWNRYEPR